MKHTATKVLTCLALVSAGLTASASLAGASKHKATATTTEYLTPFCKDLHTAAKYEAETLPNPLAAHPSSTKALVSALNNEAAYFLSASHLAPTTKAAGELITTARWLHAAANAPKADTTDLKKANAAFLAFTTSPRAHIWCSGY